MALAESRNYLNTIFASVRAGILVIDASTHTILDVNPAASEIIGFPKESIVGRVCHRFLCPAEIGKCPITDLGQNVDNSEKFLVTASGTHVPIIKYVTRVELSGRPCLLETFIDNTERKRAETELRSAYTSLKQNQEELQAAYSELAANEQVLLNDYGALMKSEQSLREKEELLRALFESANAAIFLVSDGIFIRCNKKTLEIFGCTDESQILGHSPLDFSPKFQPDGADSRFRILENERQVCSCSRYSFEWVHTRLDKTPFYAHVSLNVVILGGKTCVQSIVYDISERKLAEIAMRETRKKVKIMNEVIRSGIQSNLDMLLGQVAHVRAGSGPEKHEKFGEIYKDIEKLRRQIRFTEEYEEIGMQPPSWQQVGQLIPDTPTLERIVDPELDSFEIFADPFVIRAFRYLAENTRRHGVHATRIHFRVEHTGPILIILVEDNGVGIPQEKKMNIFESKGGDRTGMGLFLVREILAITGMTISETGISGTGARFEIRVPRKRLPSVAFHNSLFLHPVMRCKVVTLAEHLLP